ncbi:unnamed protein product [Lathyrus sativus]|nr:unnamed protein product [Lathyrus sativus]
MANKIAIIFLVFAITIPCFEAGIAEFDDYLKAQANLAHDIALKSYIPDPENISTKITHHVHMEKEKSLTGEYSNNTRRGLRGYGRRGGREQH